MNDLTFEVEFDEAIDTGSGTQDFNALYNRPSYAGVIMTGNTNIPAVPTTVMDLSDGANYPMTTDVEQMISATVAAEANERENADTTLQNNIAAEASARQTADATINGEVSSINEKIPTQASATNQLADKNFVNSSISTNTAYYISDNGEPFDSLADLESYSGTLTNNDYAFVKGTDAAGNTTYTRYKYNADTEEWAEEYVLNNSSFTAAQWAAISSGITSGAVEKLTGLANIKSIGANLSLDSTTGKLDATNTTYSAGAGLNLTGTTFSADTTVLATQSDLNTGLAGKQNNLTAGANITIDGDEISARDTTYGTFTGTDGTAAGTAGLVPAPAATDVDKFLKSDGTWDEAGGGQSTLYELTAADYNYPINSPVRVATWLLPDGVYTAPNANLAFAANQNVGYGYSFIKTAIDTRQIVLAWTGTGASAETFIVASTLTGASGQKFEVKPTIINNLTSNSPTAALSANQGSVLKNLVDAAVGQMNARIIAGGTTAPTTATVGAVGTLYAYVENNTGHLSICTAADATTPSYTWATLV